MMTVGHIGESNGGDIRLVYLTIIYQDGRVTSDNMMTWGRWVRAVIILTDASCKLEREREREIYFQVGQINTYNKSG